MSIGIVNVLYLRKDDSIIGLLKSSILGLSSINLVSININLVWVSINLIWAKINLIWAKIKLIWANINLIWANIKLCYSKTTKAIISRLINLRSFKRIKKISYKMSKGYFKPIIKA